MKLFFLYFVLLLIPACAMDYSCESEIVNSSNQQITVSIVYNRERLDSFYNNKRESYLIHLENLNQGAGVPYNPDNLDTLTLTSNYILPINKKLRVSHNVGGRGITPDYWIIKEIKVRSNNKTIVYNNHSLDTAFKRIEEGLWELTIR